MIIIEKEFSDLINFLGRNGIEYSASEHAAVHTSEEAASIRGVDLRTGVKALVFKVQKESYSDMVLVLVRADQKVDPAKLSAIMNAKNAKLASPDEVLKKTGCEVGSVHPFGNLFGLDVLMDERILQNTEVNFSAGMHTKSVRMSAADIEKLVKPRIVDVAKE